MRSETPKSIRRLRGRFGGALCEIHVNVVQAIPYLLDERRNVLTWFPNSEGEQVEFTASSAEDALTMAIAYLEHHVGLKDGNLLTIDVQMTIKAPKIPPATIRKL